MNSKQIVGKAVVRVEQERRPTRLGKDGEPTEYGWFLDAIVFDDGTCLTFTVVETENGHYEIEATSHKKV